MSEIHEDYAWCSAGRTREEQLNLPVAPGQDPEEAARLFLASLARPCPQHRNEIIHLRSHGCGRDYNQRVPSDDPADRPHGGFKPGYFVIVSPGACPACATCRRLAGFGVPRLFHEASFDTFIADNDELRHHLKACQEFAARPRGFLVMLGKVGSGKTHLAAAILRAAMPGNARYYRHLDLIETLREGYQLHRHNTTPPIRHECRDASLLVIDEIGLVKSGNDGDTLLHDILDYRCSEMRPTVLCSNIPAEEMKACIGERLVDRIRQTLSDGAILNFNSPSRRESLNSDYLGRCP